MPRFTRPLLLLLFLALSLLGLLHHEFWNDEAHHFLLGRDVAVLSDLLNILGRDIHPYLWNLLIWLSCKVYNHPESMQLLNLCFSLITAVIILYHAPFPLWQRTALLFSYFIFYEYGIISRNYAIVTSVVFVLLYLFNRGRLNYILLFALLALLANTHFHGMLMSFFFVAFLIKHAYEIHKHKRNKQLFRGCVIFFAGLILLFAQIVTTEPHIIKQFNAFSIWDATRLSKSFSIGLKGLLHLQDIGSYHIWNSNIFINTSKWLAFPAAVLAWLLPFFILQKCRNLQRIYYAVALLMLAFAFRYPVGISLRHCGFLFILLVAARWLYLKYYPEIAHENKQGNLAFGALLILQVVAMIIMYLHDFHFPFSHGKQAAYFIEKLNRENPLPVFGDNYALPVYSVYSGKPAINAATLLPASYIDWRKEPLSEQQQVSQAFRYLRQEHLSQLLLIKIGPIVDNEILRNPEISLAGVFNQSIIKSEQYYLYRISLSPP